MCNVYTPLSCFNCSPTSNKHLLRAKVMTFDYSFLKNVLHNIKRLLDPSWMLSYAFMGQVVLLALILFKCLIQQIRH